MTIELTEREADMLNKMVLEVKRKGLGWVEFDPTLLDPFRRKLRAAFPRLPKRPGRHVNASVT